MYFQSGDEFTVNSTTARAQAQADLTRLADGRLLAVWIDADFNTTADRFVRAQFYAADGTPSGAEVTLVAANGIIRPDVTGLADGGFALTWIGGPLRAQTFDATGVATAAPVTLSPTAASAVNQPDIAALTDGGYAAVWDDQRTGGSDASGSGIRLSVFASGGAAIVTDIVVNTATSGNQADAAVTGLANGGFVVTWTDRGPRGSGATWLVKAQLFDAGGTRVGSEITVSDPATSPSAIEPTAATLTNGNFVVAWADGSTQHAQVFSPAGVKLGGEATVAGGMNATAAVGPAVTALAGGGFALSWQDNASQPSDGSGSAIFVQAFTAAAVADGPILRANSQADGNQVDPSIVGLADGGFMVSWTDQHGAGYDDDEVRAQLFARAPEPATIAIVSNGGGDVAAVTAAENATIAAQVTARATGTDAPIVYAIVGGADAALFAIDSATGALTFVAAPDFEAAGDQGGDNVYDVTVSATAGDVVDSQTLAIRVTNVNEAPGGLTGGIIAVDENVVAVAVLSATDPDGDALSYGISGGADAALFTIDAATGALRFVAAPDFEAPTSADGSNDYRVTVSVSDGTLGETRDVVVRVRNVNEAPTIISNGGGDAASVALAENLTAVTTVRAVDAEGAAVTYRIAGGADAARFTIDAAGVLRFAAAPDFESPRDADGDNRYDVIVEASDGTAFDRQALSVTVTNQVEAVTIKSFGGASSAQTSVQENTVAVATLAASAGDGGAARFAIVGGADAARFVIDYQTGALRFAAAPNHEAPNDSNGDNRYDVIVEASDGLSSDTQSLTVTVIDIRDGVTLSGSSGADSFSPTAGTAALRTTDAEDTVYGQGGNDTIQGGGGEDRLDGGAGNDVLVGGLDADEMIGGTGADHFYFTSTLDSRVGAADRIYDFASSQGDKINLAMIDANPNASGDQAFSFIGTAAFTGAIGQVRYMQSGGDTVIFADLNGDRVADIQITLSGNIALAAGDFVL